MLQNGDKVLINDKGKKFVQDAIDHGECDGPIPETLEGEVVDASDYTWVKLPLIWKRAEGARAERWPFTSDELISIKG